METCVFVCLFSMKPTHLDDLLFFCNIMLKFEYFDVLCVIIIMLVTYREI